MRFTFWSLHLFLFAYLKNIYVPEAMFKTEYRNLKPFSLTFFILIVIMIKLLLIYFLIKYHKNFCVKKLNRSIFVGL